MPSGEHNLLLLSMKTTSLGFSLLLVVGGTVGLGDLGGLFQP